MRKWSLRMAFVFFTLLVLLGVAAFLFPQKCLCVDGGPVKADVMVVLGGGSHDRPERAAELFKEHAAPRILVSGLGDCKIYRRALMEAGVPARAIQMEDQSRTTRENAIFTVKLLRAQARAASSSSPRGIIRAGRWLVSSTTGRRCNFTRAHPISAMPAPTGRETNSRIAFIWSISNCSVIGCAMEFRLSDLR